MSDMEYFIFSYIFKSKKNPRVKVYLSKDDEFVESMDDVFIFADYYNAFNYRHFFNHNNKSMRVHIGAFEAGSVSGGGREKKKENLNKLVTKHEKK